MKSMIKDVLNGMYSLSPILILCAVSAFALAGPGNIKLFSADKKILIRQTDEREAKNAKSTYVLRMPGQPIACF